MAHVEEQIDVKHELAVLPTYVRAVILAIRLLGLIGVIIVLVGVNTARELGLFEDQASRDRKTIIQSSIEQSKVDAEQTALLKDNQAVLNRTLAVIERQNSNIEGLQRTQCMLIQGITDKERRSCVNGEKW